MGLTLAASHSGTNIWTAAVVEAGATSTTVSLSLSNIMAPSLTCVAAVLLCTFVVAQSATVAELEARIDELSHIESGVFRFSNSNNWGSSSGGFRKKEVATNFMKAYRRNPVIQYSVVHLEYAFKDDQAHSEVDYDVSISKLSNTGLTISVGVKDDNILSNFQIKAMTVRWTAFAVTANAAPNVGK